MGAEASGTTADAADRPVESVLEMQVELHRRGFSCGSIDGVMGPQTAAALKSFQRSLGLNEAGWLTAETRAELRLTAPALTTHTLRDEDLATLQMLPTTWLEKIAAAFPKPFDRPRVGRGALSRQPALRAQPEPRNRLDCR
jgi:peptidoglycan hydrolase-like protein with peptidoglycan-binding domain